MSITLTCNVTGKTVIWTNKEIINKHINKHGSLEAFKAAYVSRGALKQPPKPSIMKQIFEDGIKLAPKGLSTKHMTNEDYVKHYEAKIAALVAANASQSEINWMMQRLDRWRAA